MNDQEKTIYALEEEISRLRDENRKLEETVQWMHDLIWKLVSEREEKKAAGQSGRESEKQ